VTEDGIETEVRNKQNLKAPSPILVTELGMEKEVKAWQESNV